MIVVFDIGNVLLRWNPRNLFRKTFEDEARMERFLATACSMDWIAHTDIAADFSRAVAERAKAFPEFAEELRIFDARWIETLGGPIEENVALMRRSEGAGRPVHALSNFADEKFALAARSDTFSDEFDTCVVSGHVGSRSRIRRIFEILFARVGWPPERAAFHRRFARQRARRGSGGDGGDRLSPRRRSRERIALAERAARPPRMVTAQLALFLRSAEGHLGGRGRPVGGRCLHCS